MLHILYFAVHYLFVFRHNLTPVFIKWKLFSFYLNMLYHDRSLNMKMIKNMIFKERFFNIFLFCHPSSLQGHVIISLVIYITTFDLFLILSFDFCRFWVVFDFFIHATTANELRLRRIFYPRCYPLYLFSYLNSWERASISLFNVEC